MQTTMHVTGGRGVATITIARSPIEVFGYLADLRNMVTWWPEHPSYARLHGDGGNGTIYGWTYFASPVGALGISIVRAYDPGRRFAYRVAGTGVWVKAEYTLTAEEGGTLLTVEMRTPLLRLPLFAPRFGAEVSRALDRLALAIVPAA